MIIASVLTGISSQTRLRAKSSAVLLATLLVLYSVDRNWTRESSGIVGRSNQDREEYELLIAVIVTLAVALSIIGY